VDRTFALRNPGEKKKNYIDYKRWSSPLNFSGGGKSAPKEGYLRKNPGHIKGERGRSRKRSTQGKRLIGTKRSGISNGKPSLKVGGGHQRDYFREGSGGGGPEQGPHIILKPHSDRRRWGPDSGEGKIPAFRKKVANTEGLGELKRHQNPGQVRGGRN